MLLPITTDRLLLRRYHPADVRATHGYYGDPEVVRWVPWEPWTLDETEERVRRRCDRTTWEGPDSTLSLVVSHLDVLVGDICMWPTDYTMRVGEMGWAFDPEHQGRGFASEAVSAFIGTAFDVLGLHRVVAHVDPRNQASLRLCQRVGMTMEGQLRSHSLIKGEWVDTVLFGILATDVLGASLGP